MILVDAYKKLLKRGANDRHNESIRLQHLPQRLVGLSTGTSTEGQTDQKPEKLAYKLAVEAASCRMKETAAAPCLEGPSILSVLKSS